MSSRETATRRCSVLTLAVGRAWPTFRNNRTMPRTSWLGQSRKCRSTEGVRENDPLSVLQMLVKVAGLHPARYYDEFYMRIFFRRADPFLRDNARTIPWPGVPLPEDKLENNWKIIRAEVGCLSHIRVGCAHISSWSPVRIVIASYLCLPGRMIVN